MGPVHLKAGVSVVFADVLLCSGEIVRNSDPMKLEQEGSSIEWAMEL
jgi:hypothetical protein